MLHELGGGCVGCGPGGGWGGGGVVGLGGGGGGGGGSPRPASRRGVKTTRAEPENAGAHDAPDTPGLPMRCARDSAGDRCPGGRDIRSETAAGHHAPRVSGAATKPVGLARPSAVGFGVRAGDRAGSVRWPVWWWAASPPTDQISGGVGVLGRPKRGRGEAGSRRSARGTERTACSLAGVFGQERSAGPADRPTRWSRLLTGS